MPTYKPGYSPDGTPKKPNKPSTPPGPRYGPDHFPIPQPKETRHWIPETSGTDLDGFQWTIPGHWSDEKFTTPELAPPAFHSSHSCQMNGAFIVFGGYIQIYDNEVPAGQHGHELYLAFGGVGIGGMHGAGTLSTTLSSWEEFHTKVDSFFYLAVSPPPDISTKISFDPSTSKLAFTIIEFRDSKGNTIGHAIPSLSFDVGIASGSVTVKS